MADYLTSTDVVNASAGGRLGTVWGSLASGAQNDYIAASTARVDQMTGQAGGPGVLLTQTGLTHTVIVSQRTDTLHLPNKPVTAISAISVTSLDGSLLCNYYCQDGVTVFRTGGRSFRYVAAPSVPPPFVRAPWNLPFPEDTIVQVTYNSGYASAPSPVKRAAAYLLAADLFGFLDNPAGNQDINDQGTDITIWGRSILGNAAQVEASRLLEPYRLTYIPSTAI